MQFLAHAVADGAGTGEEPMEINVRVIDQNDNKPVFSQDTYLGEVAEASVKGTVSDSQNMFPDETMARGQKNNCLNVLVTKSTCVHDA